MTHRIGTTVVDLAGADRLSAAEVSQSIERFWQDFPLAAGKLAYVGLEDFPDPSMREDCVATTSRVDSYPMPPMGRVHAGTTYRIDLNREYYGLGRYDYRARRTDEAFRAGAFALGAPGASFDHELGHILDVNTATESLDSKPYSFRYIDFFDAPSVSTYAMNGPHECFAEAFCAWWNGCPVGNANVRRAIEVVTSGARGLERAA